MNTEYYVAINGEPKGPFSLEEVLNMDLKPESLVWKTGLENWIKAADMPELSPIFQPEETVEPEERIWYAMIDGNRRVGPMAASELIQEGLKHNTPVWTPGMPDWQQASTREELRKVLEEENMKNTSHPYGQNVPPNPFAQNPQYNNNYYYGSHRKHQGYNPERNQNRYPYEMRTNWLPWAIGATVAGFLCSCIGAIFGIIGIVQANKANTLYSQGYDDAADQANGNAKIMTIIGYVFAGIGIFATIFLKGFYSSFLNF